MNNSLCHIIYNNKKCCGTNIFRVKIFNELRVSVRDSNIRNRLFELIYLNYGNPEKLFHCNITLKIIDDVMLLIEKHFLVKFRLFLG